MKNKPQTKAFEKELYQENEKNANHYTIRCLMYAAGITVLIWILNLLDFFAVDDVLMNVAMPIGICLMMIPLFLERFVKIPSNILRYILFLFFVFAIAILSVDMPRHLILAWACPIVLACHYYSPSFARFALITTLIMMLIALYAGMYLGEWENNILDFHEPIDGVMERHAYIMARKQEGRDLLKLAFNFYFLPRAGILCVLYLICSTLSKRTRSLLVKQEEAVGETERISAELNVANHIQTSMLPNLFPAFPEREEFDIYASMTPAKEVGGDFYDFFMVDDRHLAIVIADVSGKGVPAALFMVIGKTLIKDHTQPGRDLGEIFTEVNELLCESNSEGLFITAFEGVLDLDTGEFVYVNAGHEMPFVCKVGGDFELYKIRAGFVLAGMEGMQYRAGSMMLEPGDKIFQYTDGVTEATNKNNELYGMKRLDTILNKVKNMAPQAILPAVKSDMDEFVGETPQFDDVTMLCLEYKAKRKLKAEDVHNYDHTLLNTTDNHEEKI